MRRFGENSPPHRSGELIAIATSDCREHKREIKNAAHYDIKTGELKIYNEAENKFVAA